MQQKMSKVMWAVLTLSSMALCTNSALAQNNASRADSSNNVAVLVTATYNGEPLAELDGDPMAHIELTGYDDECDKARKARDAVGDALITAKENQEKAYKKEAEVQKEVGAIYERLGSPNPPTPEELADAAKKSTDARNAVIDANRKVAGLDNAYDVLEKLAKDICENTGIVPIPPTTPLPNPPRIALTKPTPKARICGRTSAALHQRTSSGSAISTKENQ